MQFHFLQIVRNRERPVSARSDLRKTSLEVKSAAAKSEHPVACTPPDRRAATVITTLPTNEPADRSIDERKLASRRPAKRAPSHPKSRPSPNTTRYKFQQQRTLRIRLVRNA